MDRSDGRHALQEVHSVPEWRAPRVKAPWRIRESVQRPGISNTRQVVVAWA
jgi:hypothetical protein